MKTFFFAKKHSIISSNFSNVENFIVYQKNLIIRGGKQIFKKLYQLIRIVQQIWHL